MCINTHTFIFIKNLESVRRSNNIEVLFANHLARYMKLLYLQHVIISTHINNCLKIIYKICPSFNILTCLVFSYVRLRWFSFVVLMRPTVAQVLLCSTGKSDWKRTHLNTYPTAHTDFRPMTSYVQTVLDNLQTSTHGPDAIMPPARGLSAPRAHKAKTPK